MHSLLQDKCVMRNVLLKTFFSWISNYIVIMIHFNRNTWLAKDLFTVIWQRETFFSARTEWWRFPTLVCYAKLRPIYMKWNTPKNCQSNGQLLRHYTTAYTLLRVMCKLVWSQHYLPRVSQEISYHSVKLYIIIIHDQMHGHPQWLQKFVRTIASNAKVAETLEVCLKTLKSSYSSIA